VVPYRTLQDAKKRDVSVFGVLDGHGGRGTVNTIRRHYVQILLEVRLHLQPRAAVLSLV
jgi:serine/threonine protein phosphatase PrpC